MIRLRTLHAFPLFSLPLVAHRFIARLLLGLGLSLSRSLVSCLLISLVARLLVGLSLLLGLEAGVAHRLEPDVRHGLSSSLDLDLVFRFVLGVFGLGCQSVLSG